MTAEAKLHFEKLVFFRTVYVKYDTRRSSLTCVKPNRSTRPDE